MQDKTWYSILGLDAEPLFLQDDMLNNLSVGFKVISAAANTLWYLQCLTDGTSLLNFSTFWLFHNDKNSSIDPP
jgi:hypothetical protein